MVARASRGKARTLLALPLALLAACTTAPNKSALAFDKPIVLLGEVHDNALQHALRLRAFEAWLASGARPALVMEQFDRDRQQALDRLRATTPRADTDALIAAAGGAGWDWTFYRPFVALALQHRLPIIAANVSREEARRVMRDGLAADGFDAEVPADMLATLTGEIEASHCAMVDAETAGRMALAQVARDQSMARAVEAHATDGVLLLAGNGHVRNDTGVPRWLTPATRERSESIGLLEAGVDDDGRFDHVLRTPAQSREDPCDAMRRPHAK